MLIDAIFDKGEIKFLQPVRFVHDHFHVRIEVPGEEIIVETEDVTIPPEVVLSGELAECKRLTESLFGGDYRYIPEKSDEDILFDALSTKYA